MSWRGRMLEAAFAAGVLGSVFAWGGGDREEAALEASAWKETGTAPSAAPVREAEPLWSLEPSEREERVEPGAGAAALRRLRGAVQAPGRLGAPVPGGAPLALGPGVEARLEDELRRTEDAIAASHRRSEAALAEARASARLAMAGSDTARAAGHPAPRLACAAAGSPCLSSAQCCSGLACAGGVAGFGTRGRCQPPR